MENYGSWLGITDTIQPLLLLPLINVRCGEIYTANSGVAIVSRVREAKAPFGVSDVS